MDQKMYSGEGIPPPSPFPPLHFSNVLLVSLEVRHDLGKDLHPQVAFRGAAEFQINTAPALKVDGQAHGVVDVVRHALVYNSLSSSTESCPSALGTLLSPFHILVDRLQDFKVQVPLKKSWLNLAELRP